MKLKSDVLVSTNDGLVSEKEHMTVELKETRELMKGYEKKCGNLIVELSGVTADFQEAKKKMISHDEMQKERQARIDHLRKDYDELKSNFEKIEIELGSLKINHAKVMEQYENSQADLNDVTSKLHITNKARHENEVMLAEEIEKCKGLQEMIKIKEESLASRANEIEALDKAQIDLTRTVEELKIKMDGLKR